MRKISKRIFALMLSGAMVASLTACGGNSNNNAGTTEAPVSTEATTEASRTKPTSATAEGECVTAFSTNITNFSTTAGGFKFDIELTNKSRKTASLPKSLKYLDIKLFSDSTITDVTADGISFTGDGESYRGIPEVWGQ